MLENHVKYYVFWHGRYRFLYMHILHHGQSMERWIGLKRSFCRGLFFISSLSRVCISRMNRASYRSKKKKKVKKIPRKYETFIYYCI